LSIEIPRGRGPGTWQPILVRESGAASRRSAVVTCPLCNKKLPITNHTISPDGDVSPSVVHAHGSSCSWHPVLKLVGWVP